MAEHTTTTGVTTDLDHTYGVKDGGIDRCPLCPGPHGGPGPCDLARYSGKRRRFVMAHRPAYVTAHYNPDKRSSQNELARLEREYQTLPPRHFCWCVCPREGCPEWGSPSHSFDTHHCKGRPGPPCAECLRLRRTVDAEPLIDFGRTGAVHAPLPGLVEMLDLAAGLF